MLKLYKSLVHPILEYSNVIWGPNYIMDKQKVEAIQHQATKMIFTCCDLSYHDWLSFLKLPSLYNIEDLEVIYFFISNN